MGLAAAGFGFPVSTADHERDFRVAALFYDKVPADLETWALARGATVLDKRVDLGVAALLAENLESEDALINDLLNRPDVQAAGRDKHVCGHLTPNDPKWPDQTGPLLIRAPEAWDVHQGSSDVLVAVLDTGIYAGHEDLMDACTPFCATAAADDNGHGTLVSGVIAAGLNNGVGIAGMAKVKLHSFKVLDENKRGYHTQAAFGVYDAAVAGADVISMSFGAENCNQQLCEGMLGRAIELAWNTGSVLVASSGNDGWRETLRYPARHPDVIGVAAVYANKTLWESSNTGPDLELVAPGVGILSTSFGLTTTVDGHVELFSTYEPATGTSLAAPHVSGVVALVRSKCPGLMNSDVVTVIRTTAESLGDANLYGHGLVDAFAAVEKAC